jgi:hypothetical protein
MKSLIITLVFTLGLLSCVGIRYDATSLKNVKDLAIALPALYDKSTQPYKNAEADVMKVMDLLDNAVSHAASIKKNQDAAEQWRLLRDEVVKPYISNWKDKGKMDKDLVAPAKDIMQQSLAAIERTENAKRGAPKRKPQ